MRGLIISPSVFEDQAEAKCCLSLLAARLLLSFLYVQSLRDQKDVVHVIAGIPFDLRIRRILLPAILS